MHIDIHAAQSLYDALQLVDGLGLGDIYIRIMHEAGILLLQVAQRLGAACGDSHLEAMLEKGLRQRIADARRRTHDYDFLHISHCLIIKNGSATPIVRVNVKKRLLNNRQK